MRREVIPVGTRTKVNGEAFMAREAKPGQCCNGCAFNNDIVMRCSAARLRVYPDGTHGCGDGARGIIWKPIIRVMGVV